MTFRNDGLPILITNINTSNPYLKNQEKFKLKSLENEKSIEILNYRGFLVIEY